MFLILGFLIVMAIFTLLSVNRNSIENTLSNEITSIQEMNSIRQQVKSFVQSCYNLVTKDSLKQFDESSTEDQLETFVKNKVDACLDFSSFEKQGIIISKSESTVDVSISEKEVVFVMEYPMIINTHDQKVEIKDFFVKHQLIQEEI
jgi:hypothetical protein